MLIMNLGQWLSLYDSTLLDRECALEVHDLVARAARRPDKEKLKFEIWFSMAVGQCRPILSTMKKDNQYICELKSSTPIKMVWKLWPTPLDVFLSPFYFSLIAVANEGSHRASMKYAQLWQSMNTKTSKTELPTFILGCTQDTTSTRSTLPKQQDLGSHLHPLNTLKVVSRLGRVFLLESIPTADNQHQSLQQ